MPKFMVEREIPGAGAMSADQFREAAERSCAALREVGSGVQWVESFVTDNKLFCVYIAPSADLVRKHAEKGGFPCNSVREIHRVIDPTSAEA